MNLILTLLPFYLNVIGCFGNVEQNELNKESQSVTISGKIFPPDFMPAPPNWQADTHLILKGGIHKAFIRYLVYIDAFCY